MRVSHHLRVVLYEVVLETGIPNVRGLTLDAQGYVAIQTLVAREAAALGVFREPGTRRAFKLAQFAKRTGDFGRRSEGPFERF